MGGGQRFFVHCEVKILKPEKRDPVGGGQRRCTIIAELSTPGQNQHSMEMGNKSCHHSLLELNKQVDSWDWGQAQVAFLVETDPIVRIVS